MSAENRSGAFLAPPVAVPSQSGAERRRNGLALVTYWVEAGVASTAAGAWASSAVPGQLRILVWVGVTSVLAAAAIWVAEPAIAFLSRHYRVARTRPRSS